MENQQPEKQPSKSYGKRPVWQWVLIYVIVGAVVYGAIYYFAIAKKGGSATTNGSSQTTSY